MNPPVAIFQIQETELTLETVERVRETFATWLTSDTPPTSQTTSPILASTALPTHKSPVILDVSSVSMITTPGIGLLLEIRKLVLDIDGRIVIVGAQGVVAEVIHRTQLDRLLDIAQTTNDAIQQLSL